MDQSMTAVASVVHQGFALIWVFGWVVILLVLKRMNDRKQEAKWQLIHKERVAAMDKGVPGFELPDYEEQKGTSLLDRIQLNPRWPLGLGVLLIMTGLGTALALWLSGDPYHRQVWPFGLIGVFAGVGLFLQYAVTKPRMR